ncbi:hypothetical protein [Labedella endophytica]|uniref:Uncharacterized protein n=1 Tax=Labedella endophytica TaxID=1523160 RepID=A0A3S0VUF9_9MICO|nr:hypothetical protein [Labedella endophytica]RUR01780.1 hypothetical protein ELQ94_10015 [Labedella endophytica]
MAESQGLDPRHDPIYQRGYDPAVHGGEAPADGAAPSRRSRARRSSDEDLFAPPQPDGTEGPRARTAGPRGATAPRDAESPRVSMPEWSPFGELERDGGADERDTSATHDAKAEPMVVVGGGSSGSDARPGPPPAAASSVAPWRNPYLIGLVAGGAVLALVGFQMFRSALETIYVDFAQSGMIFGGEQSSEEAPDPVAELVSMQIGWSLGPVLFVLGIAAILAVIVFVAVRWRPASTAEQDPPLGGAVGRESPASHP